MDERKINSSISIFFIGTFLLITHLLSTSFYIIIPSFVFWLAIILMFFSLVYQILQIENNLKQNIKIIVIEIMVLNFVFHNIYHIPCFGLYGSDSYFDMAATKGILSSGFIFGDPQYNNLTSYWPINHVLGASISLITNINLFNIAKWFPSFFDTLMIPVLYLLIKNIFSKENVALFSTLLFASLQHHILFASLFVRETIALPIMTLCLYFYFSAKNKNKSITYFFLAIICLMITILAHHLTSFLLSVFLLFHFMLCKLTNSSLLKNILPLKIEKKEITTIFIFLAFVSMFAHWIYVNMSPLYTVISFIENLFTPEGQSYSEIAKIGLTTIKTLRGYIIYFGFYFFHFTFAIIMLINLLKRNINHQIEIYTFTLFLFILGFTGFTLLYFLPLQGAYPDRYLAYGWLFGFAPLVLAVFNSNNFKKFGLILLVSFLFFNIYMIEQRLWNIKADSILAAPSQEDYSFAQTFKFYNDSIATNHNISLAIFDVHNKKADIITQDIKKPLTLKDYDWIVVNKEELRLIKKYHEEKNTSIDQLINLGSKNYFDKIYESNNIQAYNLR